MVTFGSNFSKESAKTCLKAFSDSGSITASTGFTFVKTALNSLTCAGGAFGGVPISFLNL